MNLKNLPGLTTSPGWDLMRSCLLSRWVRINWKPQSASVSVKVCSTKRSSPFRLNFGCSFCCRTKTISPVTVSGWQNRNQCKIVRKHSTCTRAKRIEKKLGLLLHQLPQGMWSSVHSAFPSPHQLPKLSSPQRPYHPCTVGSDPCHWWFHQYLYTHCKDVASAGS